MTDIKRAKQLERADRSLEIALRLVREAWSDTAEYAYGMRPEFDAAQSALARLREAFGVKE